MEDYRREEIKEIEGAESLNELLKELKAISDEWGSLYGPIVKAQRESL